MDMTKAQERENLRNIIQQWNANRLDLFEISEPNEVLRYIHGHFVFIHTVYTRLFIIYTPCLPIYDMSRDIYCYYFITLTFLYILGEVLYNLFNIFNYKMSFLLIVIIE